jgi:hypothetical protein
MPNMRQNLHEFVPLLEDDSISWKEKGDCMNILESMSQAFLSRTEDWEQLAKEIAAQYQGRPSIFSQSQKIIGCAVHLRMEEWTISLEEYRTAGDGTESVCMRAPYQDINGFRFAISRKNMFSEIGKLFGMQDVKIGDAALCLERR